MDEPMVGLPTKTITEFSTYELMDALKSKLETELTHVSSSAFVSLDIDGPADVLIVHSDERKTVA